MVCVKCEARFESAEYCPGCHAPTSVNAIDDETWDEAKNNPVEQNKQRRSFGFSGVLLILLAITLLITAWRVMVYLMTIGGVS